MHVLVGPSINGIHVRTVRRLNPWPISFAPHALIRHSGAGGSFRKPGAKETERRSYFRLIRS